MRIFQGFEEIKTISNPVLTIGTFDGVHLGHQKILATLNREAEKIGGESVLFTFYPHPRMVLFPDSHNLKLIQTQAEKIDKLRRMGLKNVIIHPFTREFSRLTATEFVRDYLVNKLHVRKMVIGYDHQFGKNREGTLEFLQDVSETYDFDVIEIPAKEIDEVNISSTKIRNALKSGDMETANRFLGEPFEMTGKVIHGNELGRTLNYPTANLLIESETKLVPGNGVYAVIAVLPDGSRKAAMMNIGYRPTVSDDEARSIEVHILDTNLDLYDQYLGVEVIEKVREEQHFDSVERLKQQLTQDEHQIRSTLSATS